MDWFTEGPKWNMGIALISGFIMGVASYQSVKNFLRSRKFIELFPPICIFIFLVLLIIQWREMYAPLGLLIFFVMLSAVILIKRKIRQ